MLLEHSLHGSTVVEGRDVEDSLTGSRRRRRACVRRRGRTRYHRAQRGSADCPQGVTRAVRRSPGSPTENVGCRWRRPRCDPRSRDATGNRCERREKRRHVTQHSARHVSRSRTGRSPARTLASSSCTEVLHRGSGEADSSRARAPIRFRRRRATTRAYLDGSAIARQPTVASAPSERHVRRAPCPASTMHRCAEVCGSRSDMAAAGARVRDRARPQEHAQPCPRVARRRARRLDTDLAGIGWSRRRATSIGCE